MSTRKIFLDRRAGKISPDLICLELEDLAAHPRN